MLTLFCMFSTILPIFLASCIQIDCAHAQFSSVNRASSRFLMLPVARCDIRIILQGIPFPLCTQLPHVAIRNPEADLSVGINDASAHLPPPNHVLSRSFRPQTTHRSFPLHDQEIPSLSSPQLPVALPRNPATELPNPGGLSFITRGAPWPSSSAIFQRARPAPPLCCQASTSFHVTRLPR